jgi:hypothetical protein
MSIRYYVDTRNVKNGYYYTRVSRRRRGRDLVLVGPPARIYVGE